MPTKRSVSRRAPVSTARKDPKPSKSIYEKITKKKNPKWADKMFN